MATVTPLDHEHDAFDDGAERSFHDRLVARQRELLDADGDTFGIAVQPRVYVGGRWWRPDFLITYRGRVAVIEVDGSSHRKRWAADRSRHYVFEDHGVAYVAPLCVEEAVQPAEADAFIARVLRKLGGRDAARPA